MRIKGMNGLTRHKSSKESKGSGIPRKGAERGARRAEGREHEKHELSRQEQ